MKKLLKYLYSGHQTFFFSIVMIYNIIFITYIISLRSYITECNKYVFFVNMEKNQKSKTQETLFSGKTN